MDQTEVAARLERFEDRIHYMYRCTGGEVTVGIGHAIHSAAEASRLTWAGGADSVEADFAAVAAEPKGFKASHYESLTSARMSDDAIDKLLADDMAGFTRQLEDTFPSWSTFPAPAQAALFDLAYNLGIGGLNKFPKMLAAVDAGDWVTAASESHRRDIAEERNQEIADLFRQAASSRQRAGSGIG